MNQPPLKSGIDISVPNALMEMAYGQGEPIQFTSLCTESVPSNLNKDVMYSISPPPCSGDDTVTWNQVYFSRIADLEGPAQEEYHHIHNEKCESDSSDDGKNGKTNEEDTYERVDSRGKLITFSKTAMNHGLRYVDATSQQPVSSFATVNIDPLKYLSVKELKHRANSLAYS